MTGYEKDTMLAIQAINKKTKDSNCIDWEQRRYEIAKDVVAGMYSKDTEGRYSNTELICSIAVKAADTLIDMLKKTTK